VIVVLIEPAPVGSFNPPIRGAARRVDVVDLVGRSGELKAELVEFSQKPKYEQAFYEVASEHLGEDYAIGEGKLIDILDRFVLQHRLRSGQTIVEQFVASRPDLAAPERDMLLGWRDVVEGIFEVGRRDGDVLIVTNLVDELTYRVRSNMGGEVFRVLRPRSYMIARFVPVGSEWLVSGVIRPIARNRRKVAYAMAADLATKYPTFVFRNPTLLERGWELQRSDRERFVRFFETDMVLIPGAELAERMRQYTAFSRREVLAELASQKRDRFVKRPLAEIDFPPVLVQSDTVAVIYDETEGLSFFGGFGEFERAFTESALLDQRHYRQRVLDYLDDDSVSPLPFRRMADRDPVRASEVLRRVLGRKGFDWQRDGEKLMRERKRSFFDRAPQPRVLPISTRLAPYVGSP
jgi:hypothetical protein